MQPVLILKAVTPELRARALGILAMAIGMAHFQQVTSYGQRYWCVRSR